MVKVTGVTFKNGGKIYYFSPGYDSYKYQKGMGVVVETAMGLEYAYIKIPLMEVDDSKIVSPLKPIIRVANQKDNEALQRNIDRKPEAMAITEELIQKHNLEMKLIECEFTFDGTKVLFYYTAPKRVDFRELVKEMSSVFKMRIELRQIGIRDEIKLVGGIGMCGKECCCATCMPDLKKVSIKMAKTQGLSLNPTKISGLCGRLMCCLSYENDYYADASKKMPRLGDIVTTPEGTGIAVNINMLKMVVRVRIEDKANDSVTYHDFPVDKITFKRSETDDDNDDIPDDLKDILD